MYHKCLVECKLVVVVTQQVPDRGTDRDTSLVSWMVASQPFLVYYFSLQLQLIPIFIIDISVNVMNWLFVTHSLVSIASHVKISVLTWHIQVTMIRWKHLNCWNKGLMISDRSRLKVAICIFCWLIVTGEETDRKRWERGLTCNNGCWLKNLHVPGKRSTSSPVYALWKRHDKETALLSN